MNKAFSIHAKGRKVEHLVEEVLQTLKEGRDVVLSFGCTHNSDRILKVIHAVIGKHEVELELRHAELREYLTHALGGAVIGAGVAGATLAIAALKTGVITISAPVALAALGVGALIGAAVGAATALVSRVVVYKYRGEARIRFFSANTA